MKKLAVASGSLGELYGNLLPFFVVAQENWAKAEPRGVTEKSHFGV